MATHGEASEERVSEFDYDFLPELSALLGMDAGQLVKSQEEENHKERMKMKKGFNSQMRSEAKRLKTFVTYDTFSSWTPQDMAAAGFYLTGVKLGVQCFCCSLILFGTNLRKIPIERHRELRPECEFLLGKDVGNIGKYDVRVKSPEKLRGDKARYQEEEARLESFENWPFYAHGTSPRVLSAAGFVFTGKRDTVQCFSCGGCLGNWEEGDNPWKEHAKWFPKCEFLQSKKSSEEIAQYIKSYEGFVHVTGEHFVNSWVRRELPVVSAYCNDSVFANEELRLDTFKDWPHNSPGAVEALVRAGLFYTGIRDIVQCFSCDGCMENWKEGDDPLEDHTKFYPNCVFLQYLKSSAEVTPALQSHCEIPKAMDTTGGSNHEDPVTVLSTVADVAPSEAQGCECPSSGACVLSTDLAQSEAQWLQEAKSLSEQLRAAYTKATFRHMNLPEVCSSLGTDHLLGCDLSIVSKHISRPVQEALTLPEVFTNLNSVMCVEGETGSGKTTFLKKTAFLWASGCCPMLNRFQLVFYISLSSSRPDQGLASIIGAQLLEAGGSISEVCLSSSIQHLKHQVLFLLDDYSGMDSLPQAIETLITKNYLSQTCLLIAVHTNRARAIRPYLDTILEIKEFPFYNTITVLRKLFFHKISCLLEFMVYFGMNEDLQGIHKTPLFMAAVCTDWFQNPSDQSFHDVAVFKSYMKYLFLKHEATPGPLKATMSSCGQLALRGLFSSCFEFSSEDLTEAGVDEDEDLTTCLMSKFTAQRLRPVYRFLSPLFQEFLAAMRLTELLGSEREEDQDLGFEYLRQVNSPLKAMSVYNNFLKYVSSHPSSKAGPKIVSHLLQLVSDKESLENMSENEDYGKTQPKTSRMMQLIKGMWQVSPEAFSLFISEHLLSIALNFAYKSNSVAACSPFILQFLQGRTLNLKVLNLQYFGDHPESLLLLRSVKVSINGNKMPPRVGYSVMEKCYETLQPPMIDEDYASTFEHMKEWEKNLAENEDKLRNFMNNQPQCPPNISAGYWKLSPKQHKIPRLEVGVTNMGPADQALLQVLMEVFSASQDIELHLMHSSGFLESIRPALELNKTSVTKCSLCRLRLSAEEQQLLLALPALRSLEVSGTNQLPDQLFPNLDKFPSLRELSVRLDGSPDVLSVIPGDLPNFHHMEKLSIQTSTESDLSKLVKLIQNSPNLHVFHLKCDFFSDFESLMTVLASCKELREMEFSGRCFETRPFVTILPNFVSLKILNLECQQFPDKETSEKFAQALGSLRNLEELLLPTGDGIQQVAKLIVQQCLQLPCLRVLVFHHILDDDSVMEIAKGATSGGFQKLETLDLSVNHKITEEGYRNFFQALDNLPNLQVLNICRSLPERIQVQATTVKALSQCVSRLPSLTRLEILSWLLDEEDMKVINAVKERHPQSKRLTVLWKWIVPFSPVIQK
ncbi:baculoviral IAP repeat-containing protein 1a isoform X2 [Cricetulus griseus]|uniref:Baculoviral IAP repeat-containing protein 1a isoform X2 n=1 Tax=Cricetulus griseus TaxID=10029 RepID=A0A9J7GPB7_CRIGR|nr:baculoviral IAP repeat-containing protein 1a isoform X2 [Cricetulus griseus]XP_035296412.1 baculoviral IAP repeat-containing protein 1a isoform X2 [Cricetulus griseus]XP_035296413.1 baculoviral IAP repeat-containing protein 1a isoform X2 [Cricetulus griseus]XP_035296414.1 baculoviral IAP repeat-containing protein 1a isoform X2 [Cricetulus griseus]XP_035296415.1 baculoviral IAP repeat-containing protein 1a isoform X2 [Cricetulus griseus]